MKLSHHIITDFKTFVEYRILYPDNIEKGYLQLQPSKFMSDDDENDYYKVLYEILHSKIPCVNIQHVTGRRNDKFFHMYVDEDGIDKGLPFNQKASLFYGDGQGKIYGIAILFKDADIRDGDYS